MSDNESEGGGEGFGRQAGLNSQIEVYGRLRPSNKNDKQLCMFGDDHRSVEFRIPKDAMGGYVNNQRELYEFKMNHIFDDTATQEEVFDGIGKQTVNNVLEGFNATIFAYGQTGSGKTYSITGGAERYEDRGLIPRCLSMIFEEKEKRSNEYQYAVSISYLEIYNDDGYDLLDAEHESKSLSDLPKVTMFEDESGHIHMRNIHLLPANSVDEALNLLFVGDTNRVVCQTPSNDTSTRSHCIFTIYVESREVGGSRIRRSKLHLVDLAGSERIKKTGIGGKVLTEALHINLALHYLEQVIVALHKRSKDKNVHIPYRNSLMTSVLRDSLGGNCRTIMIATMSAQRAHLDESISTCRFAARVAMVKNAAFINEEIDPKLVIRKLKLQVKELKEEIASLQGSKGVEKPLDEDELSRSRQMVLEFLNNDKPSLEYGIPNKFKAEACFHVFKQLLMEAQSGNNAAVPPIAGASNKALLAGAGGLGGGPISIKGSSSNSAANDEEVKKLRLLVSSRDNEIAILVSMLKNNVKDGREIEMLESIRDRAMKQAQKDTGIADVNISNLQASGAVQQGLLLSKGVAQLNVLHSHIPHEKLGSSIEEDKGLLEQRLASFEEFRKSYRKHALMEEQKDNLREKIESAQKLGETINACRNAINTSKSAIEQRRIARGVQALAEGGDDSSSSSLPPDAEEDRLKSEIDARKSLYRSSFQSLKELKNEIEHLKGLIDRSRRKLQADFDGWWNTQQKAGTQAEKAAQIKAAREAAANGTGGDSGNNATGNSSARGSPPSSYASSPAPSTPLSPLSSSSRPYVGSAGIGLLRGNLPVQQHQAPVSTPPTQSESLRASASAVVAGASTRLPLLSTGNAQADADIAKFYSMRDSLLKQQQTAASQQRR